MCSMLQSSLRVCSSPIGINVVASLLGVFATGGLGDGPFDLHRGGQLREVKRKCKGRGVKSEFEAMLRSDTRSALPLVMLCQP